VPLQVEDQEDSDMIFTYQKVVPVQQQRGTNVSTLQTTLEGRGNQILSLNTGVSASADFQTLPKSASHLLESGIGRGFNNNSVKPYSYQK
jgi:hypothetical protein